VTRRCGAGAALRGTLLAACATLFAALPAAAHEVRPAYLDLRELAPGEFSVLWKTPMLGDARLALAPDFSAASNTATPMVTRLRPGAALQTWTLRAASLRGQTLRIAGLESTMTDALVRIEFMDGSSWTQRLTPSEPAAMIPLREGALEVAGTYFASGVDHILIGIDHLLFVLALLIITGSGWRLVATVTAFTLAHSITLSAATLGLVRVPQGPVEAVIALSIVFVAVEIVHGAQGRTGLAARMPWLVAFVFGLLHGFGFAGALAEVGLPEGRIPLALLFFNLGVEAGQLLFIGAVLALILLGRRAVPRLPPLAPRAAAALSLLPAYAIGSIAMFWVLQRVG
jgi:hydrogenase/urease accessory protein HupE